MFYEGTGSMLTFWKNIWIVAREEIADSVQSRRVAVLIILYLAGSMLACNGFISTIHKLESQLTELMALGSVSSPGAVTDALWKSESFRRMVIHLTGDKDVAMELLSIPPMAVIYAWLVFTFIPLLVMMSSAGRISEEVHAGSCRFVLTRITRSAWCLGKFVGQAMEVIVPLTLSVIGAWCIARFRLTGMDGIAVMRGMIFYGWKAWIYSLSFIGLALGISQLTRSPNQAMAFGFLAWVVMSILSLMANHFAGDGIRQIWLGVQMIIPMGHRMDLWRLDFAHVCQASIYLVALGLAYLYAGHVVFTKKDL